MWSTRGGSGGERNTKIKKDLLSFDGCFVHRMPVSKRAPASSPRPRFWGAGRATDVAIRLRLSSGLYGCGCNWCGCNLRLSEVRSGSFVFDFEPVWGLNGPTPAPKPPQTAPTGPRTISNCGHISCSHIHRSSTYGSAQATGCTWVIHPRILLGYLLESYIGCSQSRSQGMRGREGSYDSWGI